MDSPDIGSSKIKDGINNNIMDKKSSGVKIIIIGAISAGTSAAAKARRFSESAEIVIYEKYKYISYATCGLPYHVSGIIPEAGDLLVNTVKQFEARFNAKVNLLCEVVKINPEDKSVTVRNLQTGDLFADNYDRLIIATGSHPVIIDEELMALKNVFALRTVDDAVNLKSYLNKQEEEKKEQGNAVLIGGGYIGLELLEAFLDRGYKVTIIEKAGQILPVFDREIIEYIENYLSVKGVSILKEEEVRQAEKNKDGILTGIMTSKDRYIPADIAVLSIGTRPEVKIAADCGIELGDYGGIKVDDSMRTNIPDIYAAGDCCECRNFVNGRKQPFNLASIANIQGRCAGYNAAGGSSTYIDVIPTSIIKILDVAISKTGVTLKDALRDGIAAAKIELHSLSHAGYYPGAEMMHIIIIYNKSTGEIIGFEAIGREGIDKRTDVISVAIRARMKIWELVNLNLSYQPAYGSAKDPVNMLGMIGENIQKGELALIDTEELRKRLAAGETMTVLDVRTRKEFSHGHIETAINIPLDELRNNMGALDKKSEIIVYCKTSYRSYLACRILSNNGFENIRNLNGSYLSWARII